MASANAKMPIVALVDTGVGLWIKLRLRHAMTALAA